MGENIAFIDGQNLHLGLKSEGRDVDLMKLRVFLRDKFGVKEAHYFLGCMDFGLQDLYVSIQKAGFILNFREHSSLLSGKKKGNVDVDIVFSMMKNLLESSNFNEKILLLSGDGDYKRVVDYLIKKNKFLRVVFPNKNHSSLYKKLGNKWYYYLSDAKNRVEYLKK